MNGRVPRWLGLLVLVLLPLGLRLLPLDHGHGKGYVPDAHVVRAALGMLRDRDPVPPVGRYSTYPNLLPYLLVPVYAADFALGVALGRWEGPAQFGEHVLAEPSEVHLLARLVVALLGTATCFVTFRLARALGQRRGAWVASFLVATGLLHTHFSVQERPWVPMLFFQVLAAWGAAIHAERGDRRSLLAAAAAAGLSFACHQSGLLSFGVVGLGWLFAPGAWRGPALRRRLLAGGGAALAFAAVGVLTGHPYLLVHGATSESAVVGGAAVDVSVGGQGLRLGFRARSIRDLATVFFAYDPALVLLGLAGLPFAWKRRGARPVLLFAFAWAAFFLTQPNDKVRYLLPLSVWLALPAGALADRLPARPALACLLGLVLAVPLVQDLRLGIVLSRPDVREDAEARLRAESGPGVRFALDRYGPQVPLSRAALERLAELRATTGGELSARERARLERLLAGRESDPGIDALPLADLFEFDERETLGIPRGVRVRAGLERWGKTPAAVLRALGATHLLLANRYARGTEQHLLATLVEQQRPLLVFDPSGGDPDLGESPLPHEMRRAASTIWTLERPGPWMALYELRRR